MRKPINTLVSVVINLSHSRNTMRFYRERAHELDLSRGKAQS
jgi:hypothetical protein